MKLVPQYYIKNKNYDDEQISHQQSNLVQEFKKEYRIDNKIKKIEHYQNGILKDVDYFKDSSETLLNIFEILPRSRRFVTRSHRYISTTTRNESADLQSVPAK